MKSWRLDGSGAYSVKSGYRFLRNDHHVAASVTVPAYSNMKSISGVIASDSAWLIMASCIVHHCHVAEMFVAEVLACLQAVTFAKELGFKRVVIECDSLTVFIHRTVNNVVYVLARDGRGQQILSYWVEEALLEATTIAMLDLEKLIHSQYLSLVLLRVLSSVEGLLCFAALLSDCAEAFKLVTSPSAHNSPLRLVRNISSLVAKPWMVDFRLIRREANAAVDAMAKTPCDHSGILHVFNEPPSFVSDVLFTDLYGLPSSRVTA
ncbi:hypothetical protein GQ457_11G024590 [Hibiscus cannabinus]